MNLMDLFHASPLEIPNAIPKLGMTLSTATVVEAIGTHAVLIRKSAEKAREIVIQTQSVMVHWFVNIMAVHLYHGIQP